MLLRPIIVVALLAGVAAQAQDTTSPATGVAVSGVVRDTIARAPLAGAMVQLVAAENPARFSRTAVSDSLGRFTLTEVPSGRYMLGFFHPLLDSLAVEAVLRDVYVDGPHPVRADLASPSLARLRDAICGSKSESGAVVIGVVLDARDRKPAAGVRVIGDWLELVFTPEGLARRMPRLVATTGENGRFAMCDVPSGGSMGLTASRETDSTDRIEVQVPTNGVLRRELYLGDARVAISDTTQRVDTVAARPRRIRDGSLSGTVVTVVGGAPVAGALVGIANGPSTFANERGEWRLVDTPVGTRMLEVRALGYYPERRRVDVVPGAEPVHVALSTFKAVLDTVRVMASGRGDKRQSGFMERRRTGQGKYFTPEEIAWKRPVVTSDLFRMVQGLALERTYLGPTLIKMRGTLEDMCVPAFYFNGMYMRDVNADDIDDWVHPEEIAGIEIYTETTLPPQFHSRLSGCGSILIWTK